ncbi:MAG: lysophospholipid acyltransferase family protein [Pseudomonadota bacterium]
MSTIKRIAPYVLFAVYKILQWSWRIEVHETEEVKKLVANKESFIVAHWHGDELGILHLLKPYHVACIISTSKDGDLMNRAVQLLGAETVRGSSTRGGTQALKGMIRLKKRGRRPSVAVDGPKGPIYKVKPGIFQISRLTQLPILPIAFHSNRTFIFEKSWNKSQLPLPFAKVTIQWGEKMDTVSKDSDARAQDLALELEDRIHHAKKRAAERTQ